MSLVHVLALVRLREQARRSVRARHMSLRSSDEEAAAGIGTEDFCNELLNLCHPLATSSATLMRQFEGVRIG